MPQQQEGLLAGCKAEVWKGVGFQLARMAIVAFWLALIFFVGCLASVWWILLVDHGDLKEQEEPGEDFDNPLAGADGVSVHGSARVFLYSVFATTARRVRQLVPVTADRSVRATLIDASTGHIFVPVAANVPGGRLSTLHPASHAADTAVAPPMIQEQGALLL